MKQLTYTQIAQMAQKELQFTRKQYQSILDSCRNDPVLALLLQRFPPQNFLRCYRQAREELLAEQAQNRAAADRGGYQYYERQNVHDPLFDSHRTKTKEWLLGLPSSLNEDAIKKNLKKYQQQLMQAFEEQVNEHSLIERLVPDVSEEQKKEVLEDFRAFLTGYLFASHRKGGTGYKILIPAFLYCLAQENIETKNDYLHLFFASLNEGRLGYVGKTHKYISINSEYAQGKERDWSCLPGVDERILDEFQTLRLDAEQHLKGENEPVVTSLAEQYVQVLADPFVVKTADGALPSKFFYALYVYSLLEDDMTVEQQVIPTYQPVFTEELQQAIIAKRVQAKKEFFDNFCQKLASLSGQNIEDFWNREALMGAFELIKKEDAKALKDFAQFFPALGPIERFPTILERTIQNQIDTYFPPLDAIIVPQNEAAPSKEKEPSNLSIIFQSLLAYLSPSSSQNLIIDQPIPPTKEQEMEKLWIRFEHEGKASLIPFLEGCYDTKAEIDNLCQTQFQDIPQYSIKTLEKKTLLFRKNGHDVTAAFIKDSQILSPEDIYQRVLTTLSREIYGENDSPLTTLFNQSYNLFKNQKDQPSSFEHVDGSFLQLIKSLFPHYETHGFRICQSLLEENVSEIVSKEELVRFFRDTKQQLIEISGQYQAEHPTLPFYYYAMNTELLEEINQSMLTHLAMQRRNVGHDYLEAYNLPCQDELMAAIIEQNCKNNLPDFNNKINYENLGWALFYNRAFLSMKTYLHYYDEKYPAEKKNFYLGVLYREDLSFFRMLLDYNPLMVNNNERGWSRTILMDLLCSSTPNYELAAELIDRGADTSVTYVNVTIFHQLILDNNLASLLFLLKKSTHNIDQKSSTDQPGHMRFGALKTPLEMSLKPYYNKKNNRKMNKTVLQTPYCLIKKYVLYRKSLLRKNFK